MGVYIKGMEMPKNGSCIQIVIDDDGEVYPSVEKCILKMGSIAKAVPVPPHGDLIDRDAMERELCGGCVHGEHKYSNCIDCALANAPTIIPAEEGE